MGKGLDVLAVRRFYLESGANLAATVEHFNVSRQAIHDALKRANASSPLKYQSGEPEDQLAMKAYVRAALDRAGILH